MKKTLLALGILSIMSFAQAKDFEIDSFHTFPTFSYNHLGFSTQTHKFNKASGVVKFDDKKQELFVDVNIDISSVNTGSEVFNKHLMAEDFFNVEKFPTANLKAEHLEYVSGKPKYIHGDLTIKGITKHVKLTILSLKEDKHPMSGKNALGVDALVTIKRSDFDLGKYVPAVSDDVILTISFEGQEK